MMNLRNAVKRCVPAGVATGAFSLLPMLAQATVDTADITTAKTDVGTIGAAVFAVAIVIAVYHWVKRAL